MYKKFFLIFFVCFFCGLGLLSALEQDNFFYYLGAVAKGYPDDLVLKELGRARAKVVKIDEGMVIFGISNKTVATQVLKDLPFFDKVYADRNAALKNPAILSKKITQQFFSLSHKNPSVSPLLSAGSSIADRKLVLEGQEAVMGDMFVLDQIFRQKTKNASNRTKLQQASLAAMATGNISGYVTDEYSNPLQNVHVYAYDLEYNNVANVYTDASGNYLISGLLTGIYKIFFDTHSAGDFVSQWYNNKQTLADADGVTVEANKTTPYIFAQLAPGGEFPVE